MSGAGLFCTAGDAENSQFVNATRLFQLFSERRQQRRRRMADRRKKLTAEQVSEIRRLFPTKSRYRLAKMYGVTRRTIVQILRGHVWKT
jgi:hypothetical protein